MLPGPPHELKNMYLESVKPYLMKKSGNMLYSLIQYMNSHAHILDRTEDALFQHIASVDMKPCVKVYQSVAACNYDLFYDIRNTKNAITLLIPPGEIHRGYAETVLEELWKKSVRGIPVTILHDKNASVPEGYADICISANKITMPLLFVGNTVWYGLPLYHHQYTEGRFTYPTDYSIILRFSGKTTTKMLRSLVESPAGGVPLSSGFGHWIKNNCHCSSCGKTMVLAKGSPAYLRCLACHSTRHIEKNLVNQYLDLTHRTCSLCGNDLYARYGKYGLFVTCNNYHNINLNDL